MKRIRLAAIGVVVLLLAACGGGGGAEDDQAGGDTPSAEETMDEGDGAEAEATVMVSETSLGPVLTDAEGMTLYMFDPDMQGESTCYDACEDAWPVLAVEEEGAEVAGEGADQALMGTTERTDGTYQVTYDDWPLYYFAQDAAPGDVNGQGANDVWWVIDATGTPVGK